MSSVNSQTSLLCDFTFQVPATAKTAIEEALTAIIAKSSLPLGFQFSAYQKHAFARLLMGHDLLVSLRTGGGKFF